MDLVKIVKRIGQNLVIPSSSSACRLEIELYKSNWNSPHKPPSCLDFLMEIIIANLFTEYLNKNEYHDYLLNPFVRITGRSLRSCRKSVPECHQKSDASQGERNNFIKKKMRSVAF